MFPTITHINDVLPAIEGNPAFKVFDKDQYQVINYLYQDVDTFVGKDDEHTAMLRECRGIIFDNEGKILRRAFHKFFNLNEKPYSSEEFISPVFNQCVVFDKVDGSMITPIKLNGNIRLATKMGITQTSLAAEIFYAGYNNLKHFMEACVEQGMTPIFEWCDPSNSIVVKHEEPELVLLAIRVNDTGNYLPYSELKEMTRDYPTIRIAYRWVMRNIEQMRSAAFHITDAEGWVIELPNQDRVKIKVDWYLNLHRVKDQYRYERHIVDAVLNQRLDDILPTISDPAFKQELIDKQSRIIAELNLRKDKLYNNYLKLDNIATDRKSFAEIVKGNVKPIYQPVYFKLFDMKDIDEVWKDFILRHTGSNSMWDDFKRNINLEF